MSDREVNECNKRCAQVMDECDKRIANYSAMTRQQIDDENMAYNYGHNWRQLEQQMEHKNKRLQGLQDG
jgi:hypothetical protein